MIKKAAERLKNQAQLSKNLAEENICDSCGEELLFAMKDNEHEFSIGITTILRCLDLAEAKGYVPPLTDKWWIEVRKRYNLKIY